MEAPIIPGPRNVHPNPAPSLQPPNMTAYMLPPPGTTQPLRSCGSPNRGSLLMLTFPQPTALRKPPPTPTCSQLPSRQQ